MKRLSIILLIAMLLTVLSATAAFAQSTTPNNTTSSTSGAQLTTSNPCGWGDLEGQVRHGKLYAGPTFSLRQWFKHNPHVTMNDLTRSNPSGFSQYNSGACQIIILPSM